MIQTLGPSSADFPRSNVEWLEHEQAFFADSGFIYYATMLAPTSPFLQKFHKTFHNG